MDKELIRFLNSVEWSIDPMWGFSQLKNYILNYKQVSDGVFSKEDIFTANKNKSGIIYFNNGVGNSFQANVWDLDFSEVPPGSTAVLTFSGVMRNEDGLCSYGVNSYNNALYALYDNANVAGIEYRVSSGGGESSSGHSMAAAIKDRNKPVVVVSDFLGSAAIMGTSTADAIYASHRGSQFGSIGSYISIDKELLAEYKETMMDFYAEQSTEKNADFRKALEGDFSLIISKATKNASVFHTEYLKNRALTEKYKDETLKGGMFYYADAKRRGLVDGVATRSEIQNIIKKQLKYYK